MNEGSVPADMGTLGELKAQQKPLLFSGKELLRENHTHLDIRRTLLSLTYLPLVEDGALVGAIEILSFDREISQDHLRSLTPVAEVAAAALAAEANNATPRQIHLR